MLAAAPDKTAQAPATKTTQAPVKKTAQAPVIKAGQAKSKVLNANARMGHKHYRHHKHMGTLKTHVTPKVVTKHVTQDQIERCEIEHVAPKPELLCG